MRAARLAAASTIGVLLTLVLASNALAAEHVSLQASFSPDRLNTPTTIDFGFRVSSSIPGATPSPVVGLDLYLPAGMGLATSTLGMAVCSPQRLLEYGLPGCPANSRVGFGTALGEVRAEHEVITEAATVQAVLGPNLNHHEQVLFYVESIAPVQTELVFPSELLPSSSPLFSGQLHTSVPVVTAWANGPDISVTQLSSSLGPRGLTYLRRVRGYLVPFHPKGISVPAGCPSGGFPFLARLTFLDGSVVSARQSVPCPTR